MLAGGGEDVAAACDNNRYSLDRRRLSQKGKGKKGTTMAALLLVLATALWSCPVGAGASPPIEGEGRVCPVVASGPNYPVLDVNLPGLWANLSGGFENGAVVKASISNLSIRGRNQPMRSAVCASTTQMRQNRFVCIHVR